MCSRLTNDELRSLLNTCEGNIMAEAIIKELIASRPIVDAAIKRHDAQLSHSFSDYSRANDLLLEECDLFQRAQRF